LADEKGNEWLREACVECGEGTRVSAEDYHAEMKVYARQCKPRK
jgi:hypothetical protein